MRTMKRNLFLSVIIVMAMACLAFAFTVNVGAIKAVKADEPVVEPPALAKTNFSVSNNGDYILIATPVTGDFNADLVYEVGYEFTGTQPTIVQASTKQYYTTINGKGAKTLFGDPYTDETPMIVWEIENDNDAVFTATAYFKIGEMDGDVLYKKEPEEIVEGTARNLKVHTVTFEMGSGAAISPIKVDYGTAASTLYDLDITPPAYHYFDKWQLKTGESTYEDVAAQTVTGDITVKAIYEMGVCGDFADEPSATRWNTPKNIYHTDYVVGATVRVKMSVWLGGSAVTNSALTIWVCDRASLSAYYKLVDATEVSTWANQWTEVEFDAMVQAGGDIVFKLISSSNDYTEYVVKVKDVEVGFGKDLSSSGGNQVNTVAQTDLATGTSVHVSMSVLVDKTTATDIKNLWFGYHTNGSGEYTWITGGSTLVQNIANSGTWQTLEYDTCVQDGGKVCLLAVLNSTSNAGYYFMQVKDVVVTQK